MTRKVFFGLLTMLLVVSTVLIGSCGGKEETPTTQTTTTQTTTTQTTQTTTTQTTTTPVAGQPKYGGTLRFPTGSGYSLFDPHRRPGGISYISVAIFNTLVMFDPTKQETDTSTIVPDLAENWDISSDGLTYTFHLVKNAKWHDGVAFTADDVTYSLTKMKDPARSLVFGEFANIDQVEKVDDYTVKVYLKQPQAAFLVLLASPYAPIEAEHTADVDPKTTDFLVGTGAFKFENYTSGVSMELTRNPDYFKKDSYGNQLPYLDGLSLTIMPNKDAAVSAFITNRYDMLQTSGGTFETIDQLNQAKAGVPDVVVTSCEVALHPNFLVNAVDGAQALRDIRVRKAMALLVDQKATALAKYGSEELGTYDLGLFARAYSNPPDEIEKIMGWDKPMERRILDAQQLMRDAGYFPTGFEIRILVPSFGWPQRLGAYIGDVWKKNLNINFSIVSQEYGTYLQSLVKRQFDVAPGQLTMLIGEPDEIMGQLTTGSPANWLGYSNAQVDTLFSQQSQEMDPAKRVQLCQELERIVLSDFVIIPDGGGLAINTLWPYVKGYVQQATGNVNLHVLERVWLDK